MSAVTHAPISQPESRGLLDLYIPALPCIETKTPEEFNKYNVSNSNGTMV